MQTDRTSPAPEGTRLTLIEAGIHLFGRQSFSGTSTRQLAARANTNIGSIAYHFGGKDGLRLACAEEVARRISRVIMAVSAVPAPSASAAATQLRAILRGMITYLTNDRETGDMVPFMLRELSEGSSTVDIVYRGVIEPSHRRLCGLWGAASGSEPESETVRLAVFCMIGQVLYFRIGSSIVTRRMGWATIGPDETDKIASVLLAHLDALLATTGKV
jgi:AcrR family transcriptional regulator